MATVSTEDHPDLGAILVDDDGRTLYLFTKDEANASNCSEGCANAWPPLTSADAPEAAGDVVADRLGTIERDDGSTQVTYNGWPLYYFFKDEKAGDAKGQQVNNWWVVSQFGGPIQTDAPVTTAEHPELGAILADSSGRSLYLFTKDEANISNCSGGCAMAWPPLLTSGDPTSGADEVVADKLGTITREDGSEQVTYGGWPLYYFFRDAKPGDVAGQTVDNWWVVSPEGKAITGADPTPTPVVSGSDYNY